jgi:plasmid stability protein
MAARSSSLPPIATAITVRGLSPELKERLRIRAAHNSRSMEAEARTILETALATPEEDSSDLGTFARRLFAPLGGVDLKLPTREMGREPPGFDGGKSPLSSASERPSQPRVSRLKRRAR